MVLHSRSYYIFRTPAVKDDADTVVYVVSLEVGREDTGVSAPLSVPLIGTGRACRGCRGDSRMGADMPSYRGRGRSVVGDTVPTGPSYRLPC